MENDPEDFDGDTELGVDPQRIAALRDRIGVGAVPAMKTPRAPAQPMNPKELRKATSAWQLSQFRTIHNRGKPPSSRTPARSTFIRPMRSKPVADSFADRAPVYHDEARNGVAARQPRRLSRRGLWFGRV